MHKGQILEQFGENLGLMEQLVQQTEVKQYVLPFEGLTMNQVLSVGVGF